MKYQVLNRNEVERLLNGWDVLWGDIRVVIRQGGPGYYLRVTDRDNTFFESLLNDQKMSLDEVATLLDVKVGRGRFPYCRTKEDVIRVIDCWCGGDFVKNPKKIGKYYVKYRRC